MSTAFVNGTRQGDTPEQPFVMNSSIASELDPSAAAPLDVHQEVDSAMAAEAAIRRELQVRRNTGRHGSTGPGSPEHASHAGVAAVDSASSSGNSPPPLGGDADIDAEVERRLKSMGTERAHLHGWQDTYVFTKAMGEMLLGQLVQQVRCCLRSCCPLPAVCS